jgi:hypothetical protein
MIRIAFHAAAFAATVVMGSVTAAALSGSPSAPAPSGAAPVISRAFNAVATIPAASDDLRAALSKTRRNRLPTMSTDRAIHTATIEYSHRNTSTPARVPIVRLAHG